MKSLASVVGKPLRRRHRQSLKFPSFQLFGIEIEVERAGSDLPRNLGHAWTTHQDGSLQDGTEYVLQSPLAGQDLEDAIHDIMSQSSFIRQPTSSTHIHLDMTEEETPATILQSLFLLVYATEAAVFAHADPGREWCGFTNALTTMPEQFVRHLMTDVEAIDQRQLSNAGRYYGMNIQALFKFGSLEFRYFPTAMSEEELIDWCQLVYQYKSAALAYPTKEEMLAKLSTEEGYDDLINSYFPTWDKVFREHAPFRSVRRAVLSAMVPTYVPTTKVGLRDKAIKVGTGTRYAMLLARKKVSNTAKQKRIIALREQLAADKEALAPMLEQAEAAAAAAVASSTGDNGVMDAELIAAYKAIKAAMESAQKSIESTQIKLDAEEGNGLGVGELDGTITHVLR